MIETRRQSVTVTIRRIAGRDKGSAVGDDVKGSRERCNLLQLGNRSAKRSDFRPTVKRRRWVRSGGK